MRLTGLAALATLPDVRRRLRGAVSAVLVASLLGPLIAATPEASAAGGDLVQTGATTYGFDPLGRLTSAAGRSLSYDGLDRVVSLDGESVTYAGAASDPTAVGDWVFGRGPGGAVLSADDGTNASLVFPDRHGDASLMVDPATAAIDASQVFDPFGQVAGTTGASSPLGFQSDVTDAVTGDVWMGARWMSPSLGVFTSRDTYAGAVATPATLNRYSYANGNPMSNWDPTGHSSEAVSPGEPGHEVADAQRELKERTAKGDVGVAQGRPLLGGPMELITAFKAPKTGGWDFVKSVITFAVTAIAGVACGPIAGGACASLAGRFTSALLDGASASELFDVVTDWKSLLRDGLIGLVSLGAGAAMGKLFSGAATTVGRFVGTVVGGVVAGGATDFAATMMAGGSASQAWDAATNLRARAIDAGISTAMAIHQSRGGRTSSKAADEEGQAGNRPTKPDGPEADVTPAGETSRPISMSAISGDATPTVVAPGGQHYSVAFEMQLDPADYGQRRKVHFNRANEALDDAIRADPAFAAQMEGLIPGVSKQVSSVGGRANPLDWIWHHAESSTTGGRLGIMQLVPKQQHAPGSIFQGALHPNGAGGYAEWAIPNGAPKN